MNYLATEFHLLPLIFTILLGVSVLLYVILDGYDLGTGILTIFADNEEKNMMIASIGPFWDANETWLVLGVGILLVAFPAAHGVILGALYLPSALMLIALILRGVSFDFRSKVRPDRAKRWNFFFFLGSLLTALSQGYMLGLYITGFDQSWITQGFAALCALCVVAGYSFIGACWLVMKTEGALQKKSIKQARICLWLAAFGIGLVSIVTPLVNDYIFDKWFTLPNMLLLAPIPLFTGGLVIGLDRLLSEMPFKEDRFSYTPLIGAVTVFILCFHGLAYSFYPYIVPGKMTIYGAASSDEALKIILVGVLFVLPCILGYTIFAYRVFRGKVRKLEYY